MASLSVLKSYEIKHKLGEGCENCGKHIAQGKKGFYVIDRETWQDVPDMARIVREGLFESVSCSSVCAKELCTTL